MVSPTRRADYPGVYRGINAYIAETETHPALLTPEFKMLGVRPGQWIPAVVVSRFNGLLGRADQELMLALAIRTMGVEPVKDVMYFQPSDPKLALDPAIDASLLSKEIMATFPRFAPRCDSRRMGCCPHTAAARPRLGWIAKFPYSRTSGKASAATIGWSAESLRPADIR